MRTILSLLIFALMCLSAEGQIPETLQQKLEAMASDSALEEALVGICIMAVSAVAFLRLDNRSFGALPI